MRNYIGTLGQCETLMFTETLTEYVITPTSYISLPIPVFTLAFKYN